MDQIDAKVFGLLSGFVTGLVGALKKAFPVWMAGKEPLVSLVAPILITMGAKAGGMFKATDWADALVWAVSAGLAAQIVHDKIVDPVMRDKQAKP